MCISAQKILQSNSKVSADFISKSTFDWGYSSSLQVVNHKIIVGVDQAEITKFVVEDITNQEPGYQPIKKGHQEMRIITLLVSQSLNWVLTSNLMGLVTQFSLNIQSGSCQVIKEYSNFGMAFCFTSLGPLAVFAAGGNKLCFIHTNHKKVLGQYQVNMEGVHSLQVLRNLQKVLLLVNGTSSENSLANSQAFDLTDFLLKLGIHLQNNQPKNFIKQKHSSINQGVSTGKLKGHKPPLNPKSHCDHELQILQLEKEIQTNKSRIQKMKKKLLKYKRKYQKQELKLQQNLKMQELQQQNSQKKIKELNFVIQNLLILQQNQKNETSKLTQESQAKSRATPTNQEFDLHLKPADFINKYNASFLLIPSQDQTNHIATIFNNIGSNNSNMTSKNEKIKQSIYAQNRQKDLYTNKLSVHF